MTAKLNPIYVFAAGRGVPQAQSELAVACLNHADSIAEDEPELADEYLMAAEVLAELACAHNRPRDVAVLAGVFVARSLHSAATDPVRSLEYREQAETLFDVVENGGDTHALGAAAFALNHLADCDPDDDRASARLNRIIEALPAAEAQLFSAAARSVKNRQSQEEHQ